MSDIIATRRHKRLKEKSDIHKLISDSYRGGETYKNADHLIRYSIREPQKQFEDRQKRAIYLNIIRPISDILVSFVFNDKQEREYPKQLEFLKEKTNGQRGMKSFMRNVMTHSGLYTSGVLVDSPSQDEMKNVRSLADQTRLGLNPYAKIYTPFYIRDFEHNSNGELEWVLLDDTTEEKSNPLEQPEEKTIYTLWTKDSFTRFNIKKGKHKGKDAFKAEIVEEGTHDIGYVPFRLVNWREIDDDFIADTPFETASQISKQIYNDMSYLDEMLAAGTFQTLFYPANKPSEIPDEFKATGASGSMVINYPIQGNQPFFAGQGLESVQPFIDAINFLKKEIMSIFGMDEDRDKKFIQSGVAKSLEFSKSDAMLQNAAEEMENTEKWIVETAGRWLGIYDSDILVKYQKQYQSEEIEQQIARVMQLTMTPFETMNKKAWEFIAKNVLAHLDDKDMNQILEEIEKQDDEVRENEIIERAEMLAQEEMKARQEQDVKNQNLQQSEADNSGNDAN